MQIISMIFLINTIFTTNETKEGFDPQYFSFYLFIGQQSFYDSKK